MQRPATNPKCFQAVKRILNPKPSTAHPAQAQSVKIGHMHQIKIDGLRTEDSRTNGEQGSQQATLIFGSPCVAVACDLLP